MPSGRPDARALGTFFKGLRAVVLRAWSSRRGLAYDQVLYAVHCPYRKSDIERVLRWAGCERELARLPPLGALNKHLTTSQYPKLAARPPALVSAQAWSALLHFFEPSYPLANEEALVALRRLGYRLPAALTAPAYANYLRAVDELKERAPVWAVPETNWYLGRVLEVGLSAWGANHRRPR